MQPGMRISATNSHGTIQITAGKGTKRIYEWGGGKKQVVWMIPRQERWYGSLGIYSAGVHLFTGDGRIVGDEGQLAFDTVEAAFARLAIEPSMDWVYTADGLVVGWFKNPARNQINVDVFQLLIDGEKPTDLPGATPESIMVGEETGEETVSDTVRSRPPHPNS